MTPFVACDGRRAKERCPWEVVDHGHGPHLCAHCRRNLDMGRAIREEEERINARMPRDDRNLPEW